MGDHSPYFPQDHYCDKPGAPASRRRTNVIAGPTGAEAILTGLAGIHPHPDGSLTVKPVATGNLHLHGLHYRGRTIDLDLAQAAYEVRVDGRPVSPAPDGTTLAVPPRRLSLPHSRLALPRTLPR